MARFYIWFFPALLAGLFVAIRPDETKWLSYYAVTRSTQPPPFSGVIPKCPNCNLVLISLDTLRADRLAMMPNLNAIAARSLSFPLAYTNAYYTTPSHMTVFTSLYPGTHQIESSFQRRTNWTAEGQPKLSGLATHVLAANQLTLAEVLERHGYGTHWNGPINMKYLNPKVGFGRGFSEFSPSPFPRGVALGQYNKRDFDVSSLAPLKNSRREFIFLHSYVAHLPRFALHNTEKFENSAVPYSRNLMTKFQNRVNSYPGLLTDQVFDSEPPKALSEKIIGACLRFEDMRECFTKYVGVDNFWHAVGQLQGFLVKAALIEFGMGDEVEESTKYRQIYDQAAQELDRHVGQMWSALEKAGSLDNTVVVFFSDHGEQLLEHGDVGHVDFFEDTARIPLIIYHPKLDHGVTVPQLTSLVDLMPMVLEILAVDPPPQMQGQVVWRQPREWVYGSCLGSDYITDGKWKLMRDYLGHESLYHSSSDPLETRDAVNYLNPWSRAAYSRLAAVRSKFVLEQSL